MTQVDIPQRYRRVFVWIGLVLCSLYVIAISWDLIKYIMVKEIPPVLTQVGLDLQQFGKLRTNMIQNLAGTLGLVTIGSILFLCFFWRATLGWCWELISNEIFPSYGQATRSAVFMGLWLAFRSFFSYFGFILPESPRLPYNIPMIVGFSIKAALFYVLNRRCNRYFAFSCMLALHIGVIIFRESIDVSFSSGAKAEVERIFLAEGHSENAVDKFSERLGKLFRDHNFPDNKFYVKSNYNNASYGTSLVDEAVFIGDELLKSTEPGRILAVLGHELGHRLHKDTTFFIALEFLQPLVTYGLATFVVMERPLIYSAFGFATEPIIGALPISEIIASMLGSLLRPIKMGFGWFIEYRADAHSSSLGMGMDLARFLANSGPLNNYVSTPGSIFLFSHPSTINRVEALLELENK
jgi:Zn-dependent protease with chaperone function